MQVRIRGNSLRFRVSRADLANNLWLRPNDVAVEGSPRAGGGQALEIVIEKDEGAPRA